MLKRALAGVIAICLCLSAQRVSAEDLPVDGQELLVRGNWLGLSVGHIWGGREYQFGLTARGQWSSFDLGVEASVGRRIVRGPTYRLRLVGALTPKLLLQAPVDGGVGVSISGINEWRTSKVKLFVGPKYDVAASLFAYRDVRHRALVVGGVGFDALGVRWWFDFQTGYTFARERGAIYTQGGITVEWDWTCSCSKDYGW